jgi:hypothetical protein
MVETLLPSGKQTPEEFRKSVKEVAEHVVPIAVETSQESIMGKTGEKVN